MKKSVLFLLVGFALLSVLNVKAFADYGAHRNLKFYVEKTEAMVTMKKLVQDMGYKSAGEQGDTVYGMDKEGYSIQSVYIKEDGLFYFFVNGPLSDARISRVTLFQEKLKASLEQIKKSPKKNKH